MSTGRIVGLLLGALALYLALRGVSLDGLGDAFARMHLVYLVPAVACYVAQQVVRGLRQLVLVRALRPEASFRSQFAILWIGLFCINTFPARLGEGVRPVLWFERDRLPLPAGFGIVVAERTLDLVGLMAALMLVVAFADVPALASGEAAGLDLPTIVRGSAIVIVPVILAILVAGVQLGRPFLAAVAARRGRLGEGRVGRLADGVLRMGASFVDGFEALRRPSALAWAMLCTAAHFATMGGIALSLAYAFDLQRWIGFFEALGVLCITMLGIALPAPPAFAGVFEGAVRAGLAIFGVRGEGLDAPAFGFALVLHGGLLVLHALVTAYFLTTEKISLRGSLARVRGAAPPPA